MSRTAADRESLADLVRGLAVLGIAFVNLPEMGWSPGELGPSAAWHDRLAETFVVGFLEGKCFPLLAFLLGWGIGRHWERSAPADFAPRHLRRVAGLAALGLAHAALVYAGDILLPYAAVSLLIWPALFLPNLGRLALAVLAMPLSMATYHLLGMLLIAWGGAHEPSGLAGAYPEAVRQRLADLPDAWFAVALFNLPLAGGAALAGAAAARSGWLSRPPILGPAARLGAGSLIALSALASLGAAVALATLGYGTGATPWLMTALAAAAAPQCLGYLLLIRRAHDRGWRPAWLLATGRNSLTCYVTQGILAGWAFGAYGLGLYDSLGPAAMAGLALVVCVLASGSVILWERLLGRGPLEILLARITGARG